MPLIPLFRAAVLVAVLLPSPLLQAGKGPVPQDMEQRMAQLFERLDLTETQQEAVKPIMQTSMEKRRAVLDAHGIKRGEKPDRETMQAVRKEMQGIKQETEAELATVLDDEQMEELRKVRAELREKWRAKARAQREQQAPNQTPQE